MNKTIEKRFDSIVFQLNILILMDAAIIFVIVFGGNYLLDKIK